jgi:hypothetical protein
MGYIWGGLKSLPKWKMPVQAKKLAIRVIIKPKPDPLTEKAAPLLQRDGLFKF